MILEWDKSSSLNSLALGVKLSAGNGRASSLRVSIEVGRASFARTSELPVA